METAVVASQFLHLFICFLGHFCFDRVLSHTLLVAHMGHISLLFILLVVDGLHVSREADGPGVGVGAELAGMIRRGELLLALLQVNFSVMFP